MKPRSKKMPRRYRKNKQGKIAELAEEKKKKEEEFAEHLKRLEVVMAKPAFGALCELMLNNWRTYTLLRTALIEQSEGELTEEGMQHLLQALSYRASLGFVTEKVADITEKFLVPFLRAEADRKELVLGDLSSMLQAEEVKEEAPNVIVP